MIRPMMTQQLHASILSAPLAQIDRRSLSQAWYSALGLASVRQSSLPSGNPPKASPASPDRCPKIGDTTRRVHFSPPVQAPARALGRQGMPLERIVERVVERRAAGLPLARKIERAFLDPRSRVRRSTFTVGRGGARVHVVLQSQGDCVRLIAICAPAYRDTVARALAQASFALASRGCAIARREQEDVPCS